jgi:RND family efflux transporter MFP subunit
MRRNFIFTLGVMMAAMLTMAGCKEKRADATAENTAVAVKTAAAVGEVIPQDVEFTANIEPWQKNYIIPALQGARINRIYVKVGDRVRKGQLVAEMDPTQYLQVKAQYELAKADYERVKSVAEVGGVSAQMLQQAETQYMVLKENLDNISKNVKLLSPIDGAVTQKLEDEGNLFTSNPILELMQMDRLKVKVNISEQYFRLIEVGKAVEISADIFPGETFEGKVSLVYPAIDAATRTFAVEITIPNASQRLRPGMFARSVINMGDKNAVMVPDVAVQKQVGTNERYVYIIQDGKAVRHTVIPGRQIGDMMDILEGVAVGDVVATTSFTRLLDGTTVEISE